VRNWDVLKVFYQCHVKCTDDWKSVGIEERNVWENKSQPTFKVLSPAETCDMTPHTVSAKIKYFTSCIIKFVANNCIYIRKPHKK
jgi:hypothetical protein